MGGNSERADLRSQRPAAASCSESGLGGVAGGAAAPVRSRSIAGRLTEEIGDGRTRSEIRGANTRDRELAKERVPARAVALVGGDGRTDDHGLRRDGGLAQRARRADPAAV